MKNTPDNPNNPEGLAVAPVLETFCVLTQKKASLLGRYSDATREINQALDRDDLTRLPEGIEKRQEVIRRVNVLDRKIEQALFVLRMDCLSGQDQEKVEESLRHIEEIVALMVADEQQCLSRVQARHDEAKAEILDMQAKRKVFRGYKPNGSRAARYVDSQIG